MATSLKKGDCIGIAAASSPFDKNLFKHGVALLKKSGFEVYHREDIFSQERYLAGSDQRRAEELTELFLKTSVKAILFARGGYGAQRIIPHLTPKLLKKHKKPVVGFSDITPLLTFLRQEAEIPCVYGPVITQLGNKPSEQTLERLLAILTRQEPYPPVDLSEGLIIRQGNADGPLIGGCLSLINTSMGTPYELKMEKGIFFFEDTNEKVYALDRMLTQLKNAGKFGRLQGVLIGSLDPHEKETHSCEAMLRDIFKDFEGPVVAGFPAGHTNDFVSLPMGVSVTLDTQSKKLTLNEALLK